MNGRRSGFWSSLIGRLVVFSSIFLLLTLVWLVVVPYWRAVQQDPHGTTEGLVRDALYDALGEPDLHAALAASSVLREVAAANPRLRYHVWRGRGEDVREARFGGPPKWRDMVRSDELANNVEVGASYWSTTFHERDASDGSELRTLVSWEIKDGEETYLEFGGIERAVPRKVFASVNPVAFWWAGENVLVIGAGVLAIVLFVLASAAHSLRELTRAAESFRAGVGAGEPLPEKGLPSELSPLIHAVNDMVGRVETAYRRQELFLAAAAHELRTPLTLLRAHLEELSEDATKEALRADVRRMAKLVNDLLRLLSIRNHREPSGGVDVVAATREAIADLVPVGLAKDVTMELRTDVDTFVRRGDRDLLKVAVANLLDNAISFSAPGDTLKIRVAGDGQVTVRDQGPGVPQEEVERIFEPFTKRPPNRKGHGLGLAIVKAVMDLHDGTVRAANAESAGGGAIFTLRLPPDTASHRGAASHRAMLKKA